jgi:hypothetical protein
MKKDLVYYAANGEIMACRRVDEDMIEANRPEDTEYLEVPPGVSNAFSYVLGGVLTDRPIMALSVVPDVIDIDDVLLITGIPEGTTCHHVAGETVIDDGQLEWETNSAGHYVFRLVNFPYREERFLVKVNP